MKTDTVGEFPALAAASERQVTLGEHKSVMGGLVGAGLLVVAVLAGLVLRWYHLGRQSLWFDEGYTAWAVGLSSANIVRYAQNSDAPPLYFLLQHAWQALFGNSEFALRGVSAFCGTVSLPVFYAFAKKVLKDQMAVLLATWLFAFSLMQLWYSQEARFYELASFLALLGLYALVLFLEKRSIGSFAVIVVSIACSLYTHNMMLFYLLALNVSWLIYPSQRSWIERAKEALLADVVAGVLYLPWVPSLLPQIVNVHKRFWVPVPTVSTLLHTLTIFAGFFPDYLLTVGRRLLPLPPQAIWVCLLGGIGLLSLATVAGGLYGVAKEDRRKNVALLVYGLLPILIVFILSRVSTPVYIDRVFINSSVVIPIVFAAPLAFQRGRRARTAYAWLGIVVGLATMASGFGYLKYEQKEDWRGASANLLDIHQNNRLIAFMASRGEFLFNYYAQRLGPGDPAVSKIGVPTDFDEQFPPPKAKDPIRGVMDMGQLKTAVESKKYSEIDLVLSHETWDDPNGLVPDYLRGFFASEEKRQFNGITIVRFLAPRSGT